MDVVSAWLPFSAAPLSCKCVAPIGSVISLHFCFNHVVRFVCCFAFPRRLFSFFTSDLSQLHSLDGNFCSCYSVADVLSKVFLFFLCIV